MKDFIVLGVNLDPHVSSVIKIMRENGARVYVLDYFEDTKIDLLVDIYGNHKIICNGNILSNDSLIWDRQKLGVGMALAPSGKTYDEKRIADLRRKEWRALYATIIRIFSGNVLNELAPRVVMTKPFQQIVACQSGLKCPNTIVSNNKESFVNFSETEQNLVLKSFSGNKILPKEGEYNNPYNPMTMAIRKEDIEKAADEQFSLCPHLMQQQINKQYELRVVVVNQRIMAFKVDSQCHEYYAVDWRRGNSILEFIPIQIPREIELKLLKFMRKIGLFSGSIDLIVDHAGEYWFLECNQDGQWYWLEKFCDNAISKAFAEEFLLQLQGNKQLMSA